MIEIWEWLWDSSEFAPRYACGTGWTPALVAAHKVSELLVFGAYAVIPVVFFVLAVTHVRARRLPSWFWFGVALGGAFVYACGATHLFGYRMFVDPAYRMDAAIKVFTALVSWAFVLWAAAASWGVTHGKRD